MSKSSKSDKKTDSTNNSPSLDVQQEIKVLSFAVNQKESDIEELRSASKEMKERILNLEAENRDLESKFIQSFKNEKTIHQMSEHVENLEKEIKALKEEQFNKEKEYSKEKAELVKNYENEILKLNYSLDSYKQKIEVANNVQSVINRQADKIKSLETEKEEVIAEAENKIRNKEIKNEIKFSDLKKKMMENIAETQKNVTQLNIEYMDVSTKLTLLQNHQLLIELEYQSQQIEELLKKKEVLEKKVFELNRDVEIHKEVELCLAEKNKKLGESLKNLQNSESISAENSELLSSHRNNLYNSNSNLKELTTISNLEKKVITLEKAVKKKQGELEKMRQSFQSIEEKLKNYQKKFSGVFSLFEEGLENLLKDEELKDSNNLYVNIEFIKKGEFSSFTSEEKYSLLVMLMKQLVPIINRNEMKSCDSTLENVKIDYHVPRRQIDDPLMRKIFGNKMSSLHNVNSGLNNLNHLNNLNNSLKRSFDSLPVIQSGYNRSKSIMESKLGNPKFQSLI